MQPARLGILGDDPPGWYPPGVVGFSLTRQLVMLGRTRYPSWSVYTHILPSQIKVSHTLRLQIDELRSRATPSTVGTVGVPTWQGHGPSAEQHGISGDAADGRQALRCAGPAQLQSRAAHAPSWSARWGNDRCPWVSLESAGVTA